MPLENNKCSRTDWYFSWGWPSWWLFQQLRLVYIVRLAVNCTDSFPILGTNWRSYVLPVIARILLGTPGTAIWIHVKLTRYGLCSFARAILSWKGWNKPSQMHGSAFVSGILFLLSDLSVVQPLRQSSFQVWVNHDWLCKHLITLGHWSCLHHVLHHLLLGDIWMTIIVTC